MMKMNQILSVTLIRIMLTSLSDPSTVLNLPAANGGLRFDPYTAIGEKVTRSGRVCVCVDLLKRSKTCTICNLAAGACGSHVLPVGMSGKQDLASLVHLQFHEG